MKCILLCAGYATRLYPLTKNFPKPLLEIESGKPLLNYIMDEIDKVDDIDEVVIVTNNKFYNHFLEYSNNSNYLKKITIVNDNTTSNEDRLGVIGDILYAIDSLSIDDDLLIVAGDSLFDFSLNDFVSYFKKKNSPVVLCERLDDVNTLMRVAVATLDDNNKVLELIEKPDMPKSDVAAYAMYLYPKDVVINFRKYLGDTYISDMPLLKYIYKKEDVYAYILKGNFYDIGTHNSLNEVRELYSE